MKAVIAAPLCALMHHKKWHPERRSIKVWAFWQCSNSNVFLDFFPQYPTLLFKICNIILWVWPVMLWFGWMFYPVLILFYFCCHSCHQLFHYLRWNMALFPPWSVMSESWEPIMWVKSTCNWWIDLCRVRQLGSCACFHATPKSLFRCVPIRLWVLPCCNSPLIKLQSH